MIALYALVTKQLRRITTDGKFAERLKDLAASPGDADRSLAAHRAPLLQEPLAEIEHPDCALDGEYLPCKDIGMIASSLNLLKCI